MMTALEKSGLEAERDALNQKLYSTLSQRTGLPEEQIQGINQRSGRMHSLADEFEAAQNAREQRIAGIQENGTPIPGGIADVARRGLDYLRGGPEKVASRNIQKAVGGIQGRATEFPDPDSLTQYRRMQEQEELGHLGDTIGKRESDPLLDRARQLQSVARMKKGTTKE